MTSTEQGPEALGEVLLNVRPQRLSCRYCSLLSKHFYQFSKVNQCHPQPPEKCPRHRLLIWRQLHTEIYREKKEAKVHMLRNMVLLRHRGQNFVQHEGLWLCGDGFGTGSAINRARMIIKKRQCKAALQKSLRTK